MVPKRKKVWLFAEWLGTAALAPVPDHPWANRLYAEIAYARFNHWRFPDLRAPKTFNEKLIGLKLSDEARAPIRTLITDKELVKAHVTGALGPGHVVPTLAVLKTAGEIDRFAFPLPCVVKPTHSSQEVMHLDKAQPTAEERRLLKYWLKKSYFTANREPNYRDLEHKIIVEPVIGGAFGAIDDVKVLCFHGRPKLIQIDHNRFGAHGRDYFDVAGRRLAVEMRKPAAGEPFPYAEELPRILDMARKLSAGFTFIRVDFYVDAGRLIIGELTSFTTNCTIPFRPASADLLFARLFDDPDLEISPEALAAAENRP